MDAFAKRYTKINSRLDKSEDVILSIDGFDVVISYMQHAIERKKNRQIFKSSVSYMIESAFDQLLDLKKEAEFVLTSDEFGISVVGAMSYTGVDIVIRVITVIDSATPYNRHTLEIAV
ncbi:hypothetical protein [Cytobacillus oceanisediminis]|uniref:hypothetical protein n=1 Tax=Cytobacillus oceanisediminis TaxID=665099 RepID=UPI001FB48077|nr:hypothetical protein [Cytobacillus oceanisediminis]UOE58107.1 hypothetical protein IRB79_26730 [Cytobacillus oceanisediminis]